MNRVRTGDFEIVETTPRTAVGGEDGRVAVQLGLEQPDHRLRHRVSKLSPTEPIEGAAPISSRRSV
jgi:hypothetical protein